MSTNSTRGGQLFLILLLSLAMCKSYGQVTGQLRDTVAAKNCPQALLSLLRSDSSLIRSTLSDKEGRFQFRGALPAGDYILLIMHSSYSTSFRQFKIGSSGAYDFGILPLFTKVDSLQAVVVTPGDLRPHFHRDTVEYNTAHIKMNVNANVEEMIGRLPGLQVDANGNITYNGKKIQGVLVDEQELFGSDLTIETGNLNDDMIAKVQVMDSKSKQSQFSGIDDGQRIKTLNLTLKEDSKKGYFMKAEAGGDVQKYYQVNGILGSFKGKQQLMVLGLVSNNSNTGFNEATGGMGTGLYIVENISDPLGASAGTGIPRAAGGAIHYANDWGNFTDHADAYCRYGHILTQPFSSSLTEQILSDSVYTQIQQNNSFNRLNEQKFDSHFTYNLDSLSAFQLAMRCSNSKGYNQFASTENSQFNGTLINDSYRTISSDVFNQDCASDFMWRIRGRKNKDRIFSIVSNVSEQSNSADGYLFTRNHFYYPNNTISNTDTVDQRKSIATDGLNINAYASYRQPIWRGAILGIVYGIALATNHAQQSTFGRGNGKYDEQVDSLSNDYRDIFLTQVSMLNLQGQGKNIDYVLGGDILQYNYEENNLLNNSLSKYHYLNFAPRLTLNYNPNSLEGYAVGYKGSTQFPSFAQLQPIRNNSDPLHITIGNPNLHPSYSHSFGLSFHRARSIIYNVSLNVGLINNSISTKTYTDSLGRQISQAVNTNGSGNGSLNFYLNTKLKPWDLDLGFNTNITYGRTVNYVNDLLSKNDSYTAGGGFSLAKYVANIYNFRIITSFLYSSTSSSINAGLKTNYWTQNHIAQLGFFPWKNWEINTNCNYTWRQKTSIFDNHNSVLLWNASLNRNFLTNHLTPRISINNILGQNAGITRSITANQISQTTSNMIGRYWMLSVLYRFTHKGGK